MAAMGDRDVAAAAVVRVWTGAGEVIGGGFLVGPDLVATCAHVVADAVAGADPYTPDPPTAPVQVDFPLVDGAADVPVKIEGRVERWVPIGADGTGDVALLRLAEQAPESTRMPPLRRIDRLWGHGFRVLGFPDGAWDGVWTTGQIRGAQGTGWFQLQGNPGDQRIEGGFSGAPVWDDESGAVVGMTVAADRGATTTAYLVPIDQVLGLDPELLPCPYRGLAPFGEEHAEMFFGRTPDIVRLADAVARHPVVAVAGPSGAGKSSLVRAGLLPRLRARGAQIVEIRPAPGAPTLRALDDVLAATDARPERVLVVDQFEELAAVEPAAARELLERIVALTRAEPAVRAVLTLRWSALDELLTPKLAGVLEAGTVLVAPMDRARLREAIVGPAERAPGLAFEDGLVDRIVDDAGTEPGQLPLVGSLLADLWERREGGYLTLRGYVAAGGVAGAVAQHAERVVDSIGPGAEGELRGLFTLLARPDRDGRFVRRPVPLAEVPEAARALVPRLVEGRLLVIGSDTLELAHQALIEHWPRLQGWLTEDRDFLAWRAQLDAQRERWDASGRDDGALLRGTALAAAGEWLPARADEVAPADREYVRRSRARQRREVRRWRVVTAVLAVLVLAAGTLAVVAVNRGNDLAAQLATVNAETLGRESVARAPTDAAVAAQLALAAWRLDPRSPQTRTALATSALAMGSVEAAIPDVTGEPVPYFVVRGDTILVEHPPGFRAVVGASAPSPQVKDIPDTSLQREYALSRDGRWLADALPDGSVRVRDLVAGGEPRVLPRTGAAGSQDVGVMVFAPDGDRIAWLRKNTSGTIELEIRELPSGAPVRHSLGLLPADIYAFWLTPDPRRVVVRQGDPLRGPSTVVVRSLDGGDVLATMPEKSVVVLGGAAVATCRNGTFETGATVLETPTHGTAAPTQVRALNSACYGLAISADGGSLLEWDITSNNRDHAVVRATDLVDGKAHQVVMPQNMSPVKRTSLDFEMATSVAVVGGADGSVDVLAVHGGSILRLATTPVAADPGPSGHRYLAQHRYIVTIGAPKAYIVEDRATAATLGTLPWRPLTQWWLSDALWLTSRADGPWTLSRYELPTLRQTASFPLPTQPEGSERRIAAFAGEDPGGPLITMSDGILSALDPQTGRPLGPTVTLGDTPAEQGWYRGSPEMWARPAHPGQVAVLGRNGYLHIWDAPQGRLVATIPTWAVQGGAVAFDPTGKRVAVKTAATGIEIWDVDKLAQVRPPIPAPQVQSLRGFDADGFLGLSVGSLGDERLVLLDVENGRESATMHPADKITETTVGGTDLSAQAGRGWLPIEIPVTAKAWVERLCAASNRPFTPGELEMLPRGTDRSPPCAGGP